MPVCANFSMAITINVISTKLLEYNRLHLFLSLLLKRKVLNGQFFLLNRCPMKKRRATKKASKLQLIVALYF